LSTQNSGKKGTIVMGTVTNVYQPGWKTSQKGRDYLAGGKLVLDSKKGKCEISFMQLFVDGERTEDMPQIWNDIDADTIKGKRVVVNCTFDTDYTHPSTGEVKHQYKNPTDIEYLDGNGSSDDEDEDVPEPTEDEAGIAPPPSRKVSPTLPSIDANQMRIMRQSTLGYSATLLAGKEFATPQLMVERTIEVAGKLLEYVITGDMPGFGAEAEADELEEDDVIGEA
jgi:hypothetical protein